MITVLMPTYNCANYLFIAIKSILNQTFRDFEFLIIDDGSTDNSLQIINGFNDSRIRVLSIPHVGKPEALNLGLNNSLYTVIVNMDADDVAHPSLLEYQWKYYQKLTPHHWLGCNYVVFNDKNGKFLYTVRNPRMHLKIKSGLALHGYISHAGSIVNKNILIELGGYQNLPAIEDYEFWLRGKDFFTYENNPEVLLFVRLRNNSLSRNNYRNNKILHYHIQAPYYTGRLISSFGIENALQETSIRGWREYFYGSRKKARSYWRKDLILLRNPKIFIAYWITFLPEYLFVRWKEARVRYRLVYWLSFFRGENTKLRKELRIMRKHLFSN